MSFKEINNKKFNSMFQNNTKENPALSQLLKRVDLLEKRVKLVEDKLKVKK